MSKSKGDRLWIAITVFLVACIVAGGAFLLARSHQPNEIVLSAAMPTPPVQGEILVDGAVVSPALYPLRAGDTVASLIAAAGGLSGNADSTQLKLYVPQQGETETPQRVNINTAPLWLLEALPQIGETKAQAIIAYREQNGPFRSTTELTRVPGIGSGIYDSIKDKVTVG